MIYIIGILVVVLGLYGYHCESVKKEYAGFVVEVERLGKEAEERTKKRIEDDLKAKEKADVENQKLRADNTLLSKRLHDARTAKSILPPAPPTAKRPHLATFERAELVGAIERLDAGVQRLVDQGDAARIDLDTAKKWAKDVQKE